MDRGSSKGQRGKSQPKTDQLNRLLFEFTSSRRAGQGVMALFLKALSSPPGFGGVKGDDDDVQQVIKSAE